MKEALHQLAEDDALLEIGRKAIEDALVKYRDARLSLLHSGNGFCIREKDGAASSIIRFGPEHGLRIALKAIADHLSKGNKDNFIVHVKQENDEVRVFINRKINGVEQKPTAYVLGENYLIFRKEPHENNPLAR